MSLNILEDNALGVRVRIVGRIAHIEVSRLNSIVPRADRSWDEFYVIEFDSLADGKVSEATLGQDLRTTAMMMRAVALAAGHRVRCHYQRLAYRAWGPA